jgi:hypothetical protein
LRRVLGTLFLRDQARQVFALVIVVGWSRLRFLGHQLILSERRAVADATTAPISELRLIHQ